MFVSRVVGDIHGQASKKVEEEGPHALEVGPKAYEAEDAQNQTAEDLVIIILHKAFKVGYIIQRRVRTCRF